MKAKVKQSDLARHMEVTQSYIFMLEHTNQVENEALQKIKAALLEMRSE